MKYDFNQYKREINLATFAATYDYKLDKKRTTKTSIVMQSGNDKVVITKKGGIWVYFSVFDEADSGTIVDFIGNRSNKTIPEIGCLLASRIGLGEASLPAHRAENQTHDLERVKAIFGKCKPIHHSSYLEKRGLGSELLQSRRFRRRVFTDQYSNVAFPHYKHGEVCGLELKNRERGLLVKGSQKTFWRSNSKRTDTTLVVTEAVIDALSYHKLFLNSNELYLATGGGVSASQCQLFAKMLDKTNEIEKVVIATDNDQGGDRIAKRLLKTARQSGFSGKVTRHCPSRAGEDWNDELLRNQLASVS